MTDEQQSAYIIAQSVCAQAEMAGMIVENTKAQLTGNPPPYDKDSFDDLPIKYGITHNAIYEFYRSQ
jgi:hypothetical protein